MKKLIFILAILTIPLSYVKAQTQIDNSYFNANLPTYVWDIVGSPYLIMDDIEIPQGSDLIIEQGVEVLFQGHYKMDVKGSINAIGDFNQRIIFTSDYGNPWNGIRFDFSDGTPPSPSKLHYCDISNARKYGTTCTTPDPESSGGAIYVESFSDLEIYECEIFNNIVLAQGGAIGIYSNSSPKIWKSNINNNTAVKRGGALCMMIDCNPVITDNLFEMNESTSKGGGAIGIGDLGTGHSCSPTIVGNKINNNSATSSGGGIFICNADIANFSENTIRGNNTQASGGGICIQKNSIVTLENNEISNNIATANGGGIFIGINYNGSPDVAINYCQLSGNSAVNGGGIYLSQSELDITNCNFTANTASTSGGGIYVLNSISTIENCSFENNMATSNGGGVYMNDPLAGQFIVPTSISLNKFVSNEAYQGSGLFLFRNSQTNYYQWPTKILNNLFVKNHATDKGVVYMQGNNNNTIFNHNTVTNNTAAYWVSGVCVQLENPGFPSQFKNNIIYESVVDIVIIKTFQHPSNYSTLTTLNSLQSNPNFVSATDYHLSSTSSCIDAGNNSAIMTAIDLDGNQRISNGITDYGCYEYNSTPPPIQPFQSGINNKENNIEIKIFPNPTSDVLNISIGDENIINVSIYDIKGRKIYDTGIISINNTLEIPIKNLISGSYFLKIRTENEVVNRKIVIQ